MLEIIGEYVVFILAQSRKPLLLQKEKDLYYRKKRINFKELNRFINIKDFKFKKIQ